MGEFTNYNFTVLRRSNNEQFVFTFADLAIMNLYDLIVMFRILKNHESKFGPHLHHLKKMIRFYIMEICSIDIEVAGVLKKNTSVQPCDQLKILEDMRDSFFKRVHGVSYTKFMKGDI